MTNKTETIFSTIIAIGLLVFFMIIYVIVGTMETHYTCKGTITYVKDDYVECIDDRNMEWSFYGDGYSVGDNVKIKFYNGCTEHHLIDDEIEDVKILKNNA